MGTSDAVPVAVHTSKPRRLGILALQGAFEEHEASFKQLPEDMLRQFEVVQVRKSAEMDSCDALVIPGGESTTMKIIAGTDEFWTVLKAFVHGGAGTDGVHRQARPVWGTCAGLILLSDDVLNQMHGADDSVTHEPKRCKYGDPIGGSAVSTCRNFFGRQAQSFEANLGTPAVGIVDGDSASRAFTDYPAVFIRAPAILRCGAGVRPLAYVKHPAAERAAISEEGVCVAAESKRVLLTAFHPELSQDSRIHQYFVERFVLGSGGCPPGSVA